MLSQTTNHILLVRPACFGYNQDTAESNSFQTASNEDHETIRIKALSEFNGFATSLKNLGLHITIFQDSRKPVKPDAVFPNNWISTHSDGTIILYPMLAQNRRLEKSHDVIDLLHNSYHVLKVEDLSKFEDQNKFLEGTGSIVFDHINRFAYACLSPRTDLSLLLSLCGKINYKAIPFHAEDVSGKPIYHTNVMMALGSQIAIVCLDCITTGKENVIQQLELTGHTIIEITTNQMANFAGNMIEVQNNQQEPILIMSQTAANSLISGQRERIDSIIKTLMIDVSTIEKYGGGSVRCMMAEIFLPIKGKK